MIPTNLGAMTPAQALDRAEYNSYAHNRDLGISVERLAGFFGEIRVAEWEETYKAEQRLLSAARAVC